MKLAIRYFFFVSAFGVLAVVASSCRSGGSSRSYYDYAPREQYRPPPEPVAPRRLAPEPSIELEAYLGKKTAEEFGIYFISRLSDLATAAGDNVDDNERKAAVKEFLKDHIVATAIRMLANPGLDLSPILERSPVYEKLLTGHGASVNQSVRKRFLAMLKEYDISYEDLKTQDEETGIDATWLIKRAQLRQTEYWLAGRAHKFLEEMGFTISSIESHLTSGKFGFAPDDDRTRLMSKISEAYFSGLPRSDKIRMQNEFLRLRDPSNVDLVVKALEVSGPAMKKLIQQYGELVGDPIFREATRIFKEKVKAVPFPELKKWIEKSLQPAGLKFEDVFLEFEEKPLNAGVAAQVHRVKLKLKGSESGISLVIKVLRPGYRSELAKDKSVLSNSKILEMGFDSDFIEKFIEMISAEGDLALEADNAELAYSYYHQPEKGVTSVKVVRVPGIPESKDFYFMEEIKAPSFSQLEGLSKQELTQRLGRLKKATIVWIQEAALGSGFFHADLHGGNMKDNSKENLAVLYDYGNLGQLEPNQRRGLAQIILSLSSFQIEGLFDALPLLLSGPGGSLLTTNEELSALPEGFESKAMQAMMQAGPNLVDQVSTLLEVIGSYGIKIPRNVFQLFRTMTLFDAQLFEITQAILAQTKGGELAPAVRDASLQKWMVEGVAQMNSPKRGRKLGQCAVELGPNPSPAKAPRKRTSAGAEKASSKK